MNRFALVIAASFSLFFTGVVKAIPITYTFNTQFTGTLTDALDNTTALSSSPLTVTLTADTNNIFSTPTGFNAPADSVTFFFSGLGGGTTATVTSTPMSVFVNNTYSIMGFSNDLRMVDLLLFDNPVFSTYDLSTNLGAVAPATFSFLSASATPIKTTLGTLRSIIDVDGVSASFSAAPVPEPSSLAMMLLGGLLVVRRVTTSRSQRDQMNG